MSRGNLYVLFGDGTVRYGLYNGTSDCAWSPLFDCPEDAWDAWYLAKRENLDSDRRAMLEQRVKAAYSYAQDAGEQVLIATNYGGDFWWSGAKATKSHVTEGHEPHAHDISWTETAPALPMRDGLPMWATYPPPVMPDATRLIKELEEGGTDGHRG